jgi:hypothetical protein
MPLQRMSFLSNVSPTGAVGDLVHEWRRPNPYRWRILGVSVLATFSLAYLLIPPPQRAEPPKPKVTYISTLAPDRTDAEIVAENRANQQRQDVIRAWKARQIEQRKQFFRTLGRTTGLDVDALEKQFTDTPRAKPAAPATPSAR